jgi:hypothetical protein
MHLPTLGKETAVEEEKNSFQSPLPDEEITLQPEKKDEPDEIPGSLAEIIRDLTRRPPS